MSIRSLLFAGYLGALALLLLAWAVASAGADALRANYAYTVHTTDALTTVALQGSKLRDDEETGLRSYLLTGQRQFLQPYLAAQPALAALRQQATALATDEPAIRPVLLTARRLADDWDLWARGVLEHPTAITHPAPAIIAQQEYGKTLFDRYRAATAQLLTLLDRDRRDNFAAGLAQLSAVNRTFAILFASATAMLTLLGWRATRAVTRPLDRLGRAAQAIGRGGLARPVTVRGNREFTRLAADMDVMRRQLAAREEALRAREAELAASEGQSRAVYGTMACAVMVVNPDGVLVEANAAACEILGVPRAVLVGRTLAETTGPSTGEDGSALTLAERPSNRALTTGQPVRDVVFRLTRLDGAVRWLRTDAVPLLDERGAVRQVVASFVDVTAGREAEAALRVAEERLRMVVDNAPIVLSALDREGIFTLAEGRGLAMRGRARDSVLGRSIFDLYAGVAPVQEGVRRALAGETVAATADVAGLAFETQYTPLRDADGTVTGVIGVSVDVTERLRAEEALRSELERQAAIVSIQQAVATAEAEPDALLALIAGCAQELTRAAGAVVELVEGDELVYRAVSGSMEEYLGTRLPLVGTLSGLCVRMGEALRCDDAADDPRTDPALCRRLDIGSMVTVPLHSQGRVMGVLKVLSPSAHAFDEPDTQSLQLVAGLLGATLGQTRAFAALRASEERYRQLVETAQEGIWEVDSAGRTTRVNRKMAALLGYTLDEMVGRATADFMDEDGRELARQTMERYPDGHAEPREYTFVRKDGSIMWALLTAVGLHDPDGRRVGSFAMVTNITSRKESERLLAHRAHHDPLTGLPNRALLDDRLAQALALARRDATPLSLLLLDLDGFKRVNDTLGHEAGDLLLQEIARRLQATLRASDTVARLGGDEFAALLPGADEERATMVARKILAALGVPIRLDGRDVEVGGSVGIAPRPVGNTGADQAARLRRQADAAMYRAKRTRCGYAVYTPDMDEATTPGAMPHDQAEATAALSR